MSDTCIVCLGDLSTGIDGVAAQSSTLAKSPTLDTINHLEPDKGSPLTAQNANNTTTSELIAHLQPCGHELHDECLKPWVERANSCPICRASFHLVELMHHVGGEVISSYTVEDRTQVADLDPSMFLEAPDQDDGEQACQGCGEDDNEDVLMYCDGCNKLWHTYCVNLEEVPWNSWFCEACADEREVEPRQRVTRRASRATNRRRTRGMERRRQTHQNASDDGWNQVWQHVWFQINLDLDFPYDDDETPATLMRQHRQHVETNRREHEAWERRVRVAELAGAGRRFRETESALFNGDLLPAGRRAARPHVIPAEETPEQIAAWDAFAQARAGPGQSEGSNSRKKKRKSRTSSPTPTTEVAESPPREIKRRRVSVYEANEEPNSSDIPAPRISSLPSPPPPTNHHIDGVAPSFLQSLLQEVEESSGPSYTSLHRPSPRHPASPPNEQYSPRPSSPATSNHSSPRALSATPPPTTPGIRPGSPSGLTSSIQPVFPSIDYSPQRSPSPETKEKQTEPQQPQHQSSPAPPSTTSKPVVSRVPPGTIIAKPKPRRPRVPFTALSEVSRSRSSETSPTRAAMSASNKADVQRLVSAALKPHYHEQKINKDEYTVINRDVSRMLYDQIGDFEALDIEGKAKWEKVAGEEVDKAVVALRAQG